VVLVCYLHLITQPLDPRGRGSPRSGEPRR
jgi:hypothetical protein